MINRLFKSWLLASLTLLSGLSAHSALSMSKFSVTELQPVFGDYGLPYAINNSGDVVGFTSDFNGASTAVVWVGTSPIIIASSLPGEPTALATGINDSGTVVGINGAAGAFVWSEAGLRTLPGGNGAAAWGVNLTGQIVGSVNSESGVSIPVMWSSPAARQYTPLALPNAEGGLAYGINAGGDVVGVWYLEGKAHGALWSDGRLRDLGEYAIPHRINDRGFMAGSFGNHAALWGPHTSAFELGTLGGRFSNGNDINVWGDVVGSSEPPGEGQSHAVLWTHKHYTIIDLNTETGSEGQAITLTEALAINDRCQVVAIGYPRGISVFHMYVLTPTDPSRCD